MAILPLSIQDAGRPSNSLITRLPRRYLILGTFIAAACLLLLTRGPSPPPPPAWSIPPPRFAAEHAYNKQWDAIHKMDYDIMENVDDSASSIPSSLWPRRARQVKEAFIHAYSAYERFAFPSDELRPLTNDSTDNFNAWGLTAIDALDTMMIMGLKGPIDRTLQHIASLRVDEKRLYIPFFETTIRYLGGLLSAYALNGSSILLSRADDLGRALLPAFNTTLGLPAFAVDAYTGQTRDGWAGHALIFSEIGSASLEFRALAHYTGRAEYANAVDTVTRFLQHVPHKDGLFPLKYSRDTGHTMDEDASVGAMADSTYEYFLKGWLQTNRTEDHLRQLYLEAVDGIINHLLYVSPKRGLLFVTNTNGVSRTITGIHEHLSCFLPGVLALGHATLPGGAPERHLWAAEGLAHTCWITYADSPTGLGPDEVLFRPPGSNDPSERAKFDRGEWKWLHHLKKWEEGGRQGRPPATGQADPTRDVSKREYEMVNRKEGYLLRPETVESLFILWRVTHDPKWRERGWQIFEALEKRARVESGYASVLDVTVTRESEKEMQYLFQNEMSSWFLAETLKYFYLLCSEPEDIRDAKGEVVKLDEWVLNTEAHPLPIFEWAGWEARMFNISLT